MLSRKTFGRIYKIPMLDYDNREETIEKIRRLYNGVQDSAQEYFYISDDDKSNHFEKIKNIIDFLKVIDYSCMVSNRIFSKDVYEVIRVLNNTKKNGYDLRNKNNEYSFNKPVFVDINDMINYINNNINDDNLYEKLHTLLKNTVENGFELTKIKNMEREHVYKRIDGERDYQDKTWVARRTLDGTPDEEKPVAEWINYIEYHLSKAKDKVYHLDTQAALAEVRKIAALAVRTMEIHGAPERIIDNYCCDSKKPEKDSCDGNCKCKK